MAIVGVTSESAAKVKPYIEKNGIKYTIAIGNASEYKARGIPHAWLVDPKGTVVWHGHPSNLKEETVQQHIKGARSMPAFDELPKPLKKAGKYLEAGVYAKGIGELEKYLKRPKDEAVAATAKKTITIVKEFGNTLYKNALSYFEEGDYVDALDIVTDLEKSFKGMELSKKAKKKRTEWKKDKRVKAELTASAYLAKARELVAKKKYKNALPFLMQVIKSKKYAETKSREKALKMAKELEKML